MDISYWLLVAALVVRIDETIGKQRLKLGLITPPGGIFGYSIIAAASTMAVEDAIAEGLLEEFDIR